MQIKKSKFLIGTLLSVTSIGVVGSITGTYAWYTYNTKDTLVYHGIAVADSENLEFRFFTGVDKETKAEKYTDWMTSISTDDLIAISTGNGFAGEELGLVSFNKTQEKFKKLNDFVGPFENYVTKAPDNAEEFKDQYLQLTIQFRCTNIDSAPGSEEAYKKDIYMSYLNAKSTSEGKDITEALRIHFDQGGMEEEDKTLVAPGYLNDDKIFLSGALDLDNKNGDDQGICIDEETGMYYEDYGPTSEVLTYGVDGTYESFYGTSSVVAQYYQGKRVSGTGRKITTTSDSVAAYNSVVMTVWLDGWDPAATNTNGNSEFDLDLIFQCDRGN